MQKDSCIIIIHSEEVDSDIKTDDVSRTDCSNRNMSLLSVVEAV